MVGMAAPLPPNGMVELGEVEVQTGKSSTPLTSCRPRFTSELVRPVRRELATAPGAPEATARLRLLTPSRI